jgi:D-lactate dehydrogenase
LVKAGINIIYPDNLSSLCCGMPFGSKGFEKEDRNKSEELLTALLKASEDGKFPLLFDTSPCTYHFKEFLSGRKHPLKICEPIEFTLKYLKNRLNFEKVPRPVAIHTTCSSSKMGLEESFREAALLASDEIIIPEEVGCCGFAGDRGFSFPELNESALKELKPAVEGKCSEGYSTSRTCEIGLTLQSGISYKSLFYLLYESSGKREIKKAVQK